MELEAQIGNTVGHNGINAEEKISSLFDPDTLLSAQYFENLRRKTPIEPEKRLMLAVLEDAVNCFQVDCKRPEASAAAVESLRSRSRG
jgi:hypothetical protein